MFDPLISEVRAAGLVGVTSRQLADARRRGQVQYVKVAKSAMYRAGWLDN